MTQLTLEKFNPTVSELTELATKFKWLKIAGIGDKEWYALVKSAQKELAAKRIYITKTLMDFRREAINFQKAVLDQEKSLIAIIDETEKELKSEKERIDLEIEIEKRKESLLERHTTLLEKDIDWDEQYILSMNDMEFDRAVMLEEQKKMEKEKIEMEKEKAKIQEEKDKLKRAQEDEQLRKEAAEKATKETEERLRNEAKALDEKRIAEEKKAKFDEEQRQAKAIQDEKDSAAKIEKDEKDRVAKEKKDEEDRLAKIEKDRVAEENRKEEEQKKIESDKRYKKWLMDNKYDEIEYRIAEDGKRRVMRRYVSEFIIN